jgi:hypothetical protein
MGGNYPLTNRVNVYTLFLKSGKDKFKPMYDYQKSSTIILYEYLVIDSKNVKTTAFHKTSYFWQRPYMVSIEDPSLSEFNNYGQKTKIIF